MQYFFNDHLRWNLGWETPNQAGAFVATLLPWLWGLTLLTIGRTAWSQGGGRRGWRLLAVLFVVLEGAATWALVKTYSRGALVAVLVSLGVSIALIAWRICRRARAGSPLGESNITGASDVPAVRASSLTGCSRYVSSLAPWFGRSILLAVCLWLSGFGQRLSPDYATTDKSVLNRVDLWKGGLELIAISPVHGWGWGNSGASFMHWTQPIGRSEAYKSMVNSYLTVGVEGGLPVFFAVLCVCAGVLFLGLRSLDGRAGPLGGPYPIQPQPWLPLAASASWLAWLVCVFFSNLWIIPWLWAVPGVTFLVIGWLRFSRRSHCGLKGWWVVLPAIALLVSVSVWEAGRWLESASPVMIRRAGDGRVMLALRHPSGHTVSFAVLPDAQVLGESYGQELRRWVLAAKANPVWLQVIGSGRSTLTAGETVVAFGAACSDSRLRGCKVLLIHPTLAPDSGGKVAEDSLLQLPGIDVMQTNAVWSAWAEQRGLIWGQSWGLATDARARWPQLMLEMQSACKER